MKHFQKGYFTRVREFLVSTWANNEAVSNWTIDRWNFSCAFPRIIHTTSFAKWCSQIALWEIDSKIVAVVNAEGEDTGEGQTGFSPTST